MAALAHTLALLLCAAATATLAAPAQRDPALKYETFKSPALSLRSGQVANTLSTWGPLPWVAGPVAIRHYSGVMVDEHDNVVPLTELYVHHWVIYRSTPGEMHLIPNGGMCPNLANIFGIGAELFHTQYDYPAPYAITTTGKELWTANIHIIRTTNVPDVQNCIECNCPSSRPPTQPFGGIQCCPDRSMCWGMENSTLFDEKKYFLRYTIGYVPITPDVVPLTIFSLDVTALQTIDCRTEYQIPALPDGANHTLKTNATVPSNWSIVYLEAHQHIGGERFVVNHYRGDKLLGEVCSVTPMYGTGSVAGNESGYLVGMPVCTYDTPYEVQGGDLLELVSVYSSRTLPGGHPWHEGVMGLVFLAAVAKVDPTAQCLELLHVMCGIPPYTSSGYCLQCAESVRSQLADAGCTVPLVEQECNKTAGGGEIPTPAQVTGMYFHIHPNNATTDIWNLTGPAGSWFGIAISINSTNMVNATAFIYDLNDAGTPCLQVRVLGNHDPGTLVAPTYPASITRLPSGSVQVLFTVASGSNGLLRSAAKTFVPPIDTGMMSYTSMLSPPQASMGYLCFLFAQGQGSMQLGYHGAARGWTCEMIQ